MKMPKSLTLQMHSIFGFLFSERFETASRHLLKNGDAIEREILCKRNLVGEVPPAVRPGAWKQSIHGRRDYYGTYRNIRSSPDQVACNQAAALADPEKYDLLLK
jgi:hypothetical protein